MDNHTVKELFLFANGDKYIGEFKDGSPNGKGTLIFKNGDIYKGDYKDGKMHGDGSIITSDGVTIILKDGEIINKSTK